MNIFLKILKKFFQNFILRKNKIPGLKALKRIERYNEFYSSPFWKYDKQKTEMDIFLLRNKNKDVLLSPIERIERIKTIIEGINSGETEYNPEEWYEKNKYKLWKYSNRRNQSRH